VRKLPGSFGHGVDWADLAGWLSRSPRFSEGVDVGCVEYDVWLIGDVFEAGGADSVGTMALWSSRG
jgi:hypothetical protein